MKNLELSDFQQDSYLRVIRPLAQAYLAFCRVGRRHIEQLGVTPAQFDVLAELGGTSGMTCSDLSEATLITKGTLTGVLDRLERKGLLQRLTAESDRRAIHVKLTAKGESLYRRIFPAHGAFLRPYLQSVFSQGEIETLRVQLCMLRDAFERGESTMSVRKQQGKEEEPWKQIHSHCWE